MSEESLSVFTATPEEVDLERNVIATYYVEGKNTSIVEAGVKIAAEESIGTWTQVSTATEWVVKNLPAKVFEHQIEGENTGIIKIAYPNILFDFETGGIPNILSIVAGNLFGSGSLQNVRLVDLQLSGEAVSFFKGPKFGIDGVRRIVGTLESRRPHLGTIIKPKVGLDPRETAKVAYEAAMGGVDFIKDDETLTNQRFCPLAERVSHVMEALDRVKSETGRTVLYSPDITTEAYKMRELAQVAVDHGANALMLDFLPCGFSAVRMLAEDNSIKVPIHVHRCMHAAMTRNPKHGISMMVLAKLVRLAGGDQLHTGTAAGKMGGKEKKVEELISINRFLRGDFFGLKNTFPVASGGIHPTVVPANVLTLGRDLVIQAGGGIHGHPNGTRAGAVAMRDAIEAVVKGIPIEEYAKDHRELDVAIQHWGMKFMSEE
ncbi:MAG: RuBisCO large subunit C-terminal-like domain-containing protein [Nitrososphaeria archaeon]